MNGVKVRYFDRGKILSKLTTLAHNLLALKNNVIEVSLFGSLARGNYAPGSDTDTLIVLREDTRKFVDRIPEFLSYFSDVGVPIEVFPYTQDELKNMADRNFIKAAQKEKIILDSRN